VAVRADEEASGRELRAAKGAYWPQLALVARASVGVGTPSLGINGNESVWGGMFVGAQVTWPLFDMLATWIQVREAGIAHERSQATRQRERARVLAEARAAHGELEHTLAAVPPVRDAVALARANVDIARRRYLAGTIRLFEVLEVQRDLRALEQDWIAVATEVAESSQRLRVALGRR
jgi:outer membrane protein TolC